jgi:hypothetical protein
MSDRRRSGPGSSARRGRPGPPAGRTRGPIGTGIYSALLRLYPTSFREELSAEMLVVFRCLRTEPRYGGAAGSVRLWWRILGDLVPSAARAWFDCFRAARTARRAADPYPPPYGEAVLAGGVVWLLYVATLAPSIGFWDSGEYVTVAHVLGIPHPPGSALFVILARAWEVALSPLGLPVAVVVNLFGATSSAAAHAFWFLVADRVLAGAGGDRSLRRAGAWAAVILSATAFTVWSQSNLNEKVYAISFITVALGSWLVVRWPDGGYDPRRLLLIGYLLVLSTTNHLMGVLAAPAIVVFVLMTRPRALVSPRLWAGAVPLAAIALSAHLFLPIRAELDPLVLEGAPACESMGAAVASVYTLGAGGCEALSAVLTREQYGKPSLLADPTNPSLPRSPALFASQLLNYLQYFDWQWARSISGHDPVLGGARPLVTLVMILLGFVGFRRAWRHDRALAAYLVVLFATLSLGLVVYLNFRYGWSIGWDRFPLVEQHEVRERDYFFFIGFSLWGVLAGIGLALGRERLAGWISKRKPLASTSPPSPVPERGPRLLTLPVLGLALIPLALNGPWASRSDDWTARDWAYNVLMSVEPYGILVTNGDNDSFPLWYLQKVERLREDVTVVLTPYLNTGWYPRQIRDLTRPCPPGVAAADDPTRIICQRPLDPQRFPARLVAAGILDDVRPPEDSILPLGDDEIERIASAVFVSRDDLRLQAGRIDTIIPAGTTILPQDSFITAILRANVGRRPIHFMPSSILDKLGLTPHAVRQGLTYRLEEAPWEDAGDAIVPLAPEFAAALGTWIDLPRTDTLLEEVYLRRGRVTDPNAPWADPANVTIPMHYVYAHWAAAQAWGMKGDEWRAARHVDRAEMWRRVVE